jgi:hypothetical protein
MSTRLFWEPIGDGQTLPYALKFVLRKRMNGEVKVELGLDDLEYLRGLRDACENAEVAEAVEHLIGLIEIHGKVRVTERS